MKIIQDHSQEDVIRLQELDKRFRKLNDEINQAKVDIADKTNFKRGTLGILYYTDKVRVDGKWTDKEYARLVYLTGRCVLDDHTVAHFSSVSKDGSVGNSVNVEIYRWKDIEFEPFEGTVQEARKALKEAKKYKDNKE